MQLKRKPLWASTPPALFPPVLGLFGLGLAWRRAAQVFPVPPGIGEIILGAVSLLYLALLAFYARKALADAGVLRRDMGALPGRAGLATMGMAGMLLAAALVPYAPGLARIVLVLALAVHSGVALLALALLWGAPLEKRRMTPVWHLLFVGFIVGAVPAAPLGWTGLAWLLTILPTASAVAIYGGSAVLLLRNPVPPPLRPALAIHVSPLSLLGICLFLLGQREASLIVAVPCLGLALWLLVRARYLTEAGFSPLWGAFTFPMAAFTNHMLMLAGEGSGFFRLVSGFALAAATLALPVIAYRVLKMWPGGMLAAKTNAATV